MRAGRLRASFYLQRRNATPTEDAYGQLSQDVTQLGPFRGSIEPVKGDEVLVAEQLRSQVSHKVIMRYRASVAFSAKDKLLYRGRTFEILQSINIGERQREVNLFCIEKTSP